MAVKDTILKQVRVNQNITLGTALREFSGNVISLNEDMISIQTKNGNVSLDLDSIQYYSIKEKKNNQKQLPKELIGKEVNFLCESIGENTRTKKNNLRGKVNNKYMGTITSNFLENINLNSMLGKTIKCKVIRIENNRYTLSYTPKSYTPKPVIKSTPKANTKELRSRFEGLQHLNSEIDQAFVLLENKGVNYFTNCTLPEVYTVEDNIAIFEAKASNRSSARITDTNKDLLDIIEKYRENDISFSDDSFENELVSFLKIHNMNFNVNNILGSIEYYKGNKDQAYTYFKSGNDYHSLFVLALEYHDSNFAFECSGNYFRKHKRTLLDPFILKFLIYEMANRGDYRDVNTFSWKGQINEHCISGLIATLECLLIINGIDYGESKQQDHEFVGKLLNMFYGKDIIGFSYFQKAEYAREIEKNIPKAMDLYKEAMEHEQNVPSCIVNMFFLMIQDNKAVEAAEFFGKHKNELKDTIQYNNLKRNWIKRFPEQEDILSEALMKEMNAAFDKLRERNDLYFENTTKPEVTTVEQSINALHEQMARKSNGALDELNEILIKNDHSAAAINDILTFVESHKNQYAYSILGSMYYELHQEEKAYENFKLGNDYKSGFLMALRLDENDDAFDFAKNYFNKTKKVVHDPYILRYLVLEMDARKDYSPLNEFEWARVASNSMIGAIEVLKIVLLVHHNDYDVSYDGKYDRNTLEQLTRLYFGDRIMDNTPYARAKFAREVEKNNDKAIMLYKQALDENDKPAAAVADLVGILIQQGNYEESAMYLETDAKKYMRETSYENLKTQWLSKFDVYENVLKQYQKDDKAETDYFSLATKYEYQDKDLINAMDAYKKAIENNQKLKSSIPNLAGLYARLDMYDEAIALLDQGKDIMNESAYINLRINIMTKSHDAKFIDELKHNYEILEEKEKAEPRKIDYHLTMANIYTQHQLYQEGIHEFLTQLDKIKSMNETDKSKKQEMFIYHGLVTCYSGIGDEQSVEKYNQLIAMNEQADTSSLYLQDTICDFFVSMIENVNFNDAELDDNGKYKGNGEIILNDAADIVKQTNYESDIYYRRYFRIARMMKDYLDRNDVSVPGIHQRSYLDHAAMGMYYYGMSLLNGIHYDSARYSLLQSIKVFKSIGSSKQWTPALKYIETLFSLPVQISYRFEDISKEQFDQEISNIMSKPLLPNYHDTFVYELIPLIDVLPEIEEMISNILFNSSYKEKVLEHMSSLSGDTLFSHINNFKFSEEWKMSSRKYFDYTKQYGSIIENISYSTADLNQKLQDTQNHLLRKNTNKTDDTYIQRLEKILMEMIAYNNSDNFDDKLEKLNYLDNDLRDIVMQISHAPTYISCEKILPEIQKIRVQTNNEYHDLFSGHVPDISIHVDGCEINRDAMIVTVPISIKNTLNCQSGDNVSISVEADDAHIENIVDAGLGLFVLPGNGVSIDKIMSFKIDDTVLEEQEFSIMVTISYQYKENKEKYLHKEISRTFNVSLNKEYTFVEIKNNFKKTVDGHEVEDPNMFFGRDNDINSYIDIIQSQCANSRQGGCIALYGQARSGKSSLVLHLENKLREIDLEHNIIIHVGSIAGFLESDQPSKYLKGIIKFMINRLRSELRRNHKELYKQIKDEIDLNKEHVSDDPKGYISMLFDDLWDVLDEIDDHYRIFISIDEFTLIYDWYRKGYIDDTFMKWWKAFIQNQKVFAFIVCQDHLMKWVSDEHFHNDFGAIHKKKVSYLERNAAFDLMEKPILLNGKSRYKDGAKEYLYDLTAGSAFLIVKLCYGLVEYLNEKHYNYMYRGMIEDYLKDHLRDFDENDYFHSLYMDGSDYTNVNLEKDNRTLLKKIANASNHQEWASMNRIITNDYERQLLMNLKNRDVVIIDGERCKIKVTLYKEWLNRQG